MSLINRLGKRLSQVKAKIRGLAAIEALERFGKNASVYRQVETLVGSLDQPLRTMLS